MKFVWEADDYGGAGPLTSRNHPWFRTSGFRHACRIVALRENRGGPGFARDRWRRAVFALF
jgi:hypothetical protein